MSASFNIFLLAITIFSAPLQAAALFKYERTQLTRQFVSTLPLEDQVLFQFDDSAVAAKNVTPPRCRYGPDDGKFPSDKAWTKLAKQLSTQAALIKTVPQAAPCYPGDDQDDAVCAQLTANWTNSYTHTSDPSEILSPIYQGLTCQPPAIYNSGNCTLGGYPSYVINPKNVIDIQYGLNFARNNLIRLIVKNTGHDFSGKSVGAGSLSIWTHNLKDITFYDQFLDEPGYKGPAFKAGAGVQAYELYQAAHQHNVVVVGGEGQTVGIMGGYIQGGGHSPLSGLHGMAADQVLGFEVVTSTGDFVSANSTSNPDLFWALRGGGGSTFGIVTSVIIKAYPEMPVAAVSLGFNTSKTINHDRFWDSIHSFMEQFNDFADAGMYTYFMLAPSGQDLVFRMQPLFAPNKTLNETQALLKPWFNHMQRSNFPINPKYARYDNFYSAWQAEFPLEPQSDVQTAFASRLFPSSSFDNKSATGLNSTFGVLRDTVEKGGSIVGFNVAPTLARGGNPDNAVNPAWRTAVLHAITGHRWNTTATTSDILAARRAFTNGTMQRWRDVSPGSGSYLNEADRLEPNFQQSFWGDKYTRLLSIKKSTDPKQVFWAANSVGSEDWLVESVDGLPDENGRLCKRNGTTTTTSSRRYGGTPTPTPTASPARLF